MKNIIFFFLLATCQAFSQSTDTVTVKKDSVIVLTPVAEAFDTVKVVAIVADRVDVPLYARNYLLITRKWVFDPQANKQPQVVEQWLQLNRAGIQPKVKPTSVVWLKPLK